MQSSADRTSRASSTTASAAATRTRWASRRSTCCSTPSRSTSCSTSTRCWPPSRAVTSNTSCTRSSCSRCSRSQRPCAETSARSPDELQRLRAAVTDVARRHRPARGVGGHAPVQPVREAADHRPRPLPRTRRPAPVRRAPRADLRHAHPRRDRRPGEGRRRAQRHARPPPAAARAQRVVAVLARRGDGPRVDAPARLRRLPALRPSPALPGLRRLRARRRPARAVGLHRRLHAHLVGHPASPTAGHDRGADLRRRDAHRGRDRHRRLLPVHS